MAERPGIVFYFDLLDTLEDFTNEEIGRLFLAAMRYGYTGEIAEFEDRAMKSVWKQMMQNVDRDQVRFDNKILQRKFAGWKSSQKRKGIPEEDMPDFDEWLSTVYPSKVVDGRIQPLTAVDEEQRNQPPTTTTTTTPSPTSSPSPSISPKKEEEWSGEKIEGSGGEEEPAPIGTPYSSPTDEEWTQMRDSAISKFEKYLSQKGNVIGG